MFGYLSVPSTLVPNQELEIQGLDARLYRQAAGTFRTLRRQAEFKQLWYRIRRQSGNLLDLSTVSRACRISSQYAQGIQSIPLDNIVGSVSRSRDFDLEFRPLLASLKERWVKIAALRMMNVSLPAVELIRVGEAYFVVDGHHRISVAHALRQSYIDAQVVVWHLEIMPCPELVSTSMPVRRLSSASLSLAKGG